MIEINGMAHVILTVSSFEKALAFYGDLLPAFGMQNVFENEKFGYWVGGRTALGVQRCEEAYSTEQFVQYRVGLHHLCFRAKSRADVDLAAEKLHAMGATIVKGPQEGDWAPGYYYLLFEDPDRIRLEICFVPGGGLLEQGNRFEPGNDFGLPSNSAN